MKPAPKAFFFDIGNVLLRLKADDFLKRVQSAHPNMDIAAFREALRHPEGTHAAYEKGRITGREFHSSLVDKWGLRWDFDRWLPEWNDYFAPNRPMDALLGKLSGKAKFYALSNTNAEHYAHLLHQYRLFDSFEEVFGSFQHDSRKPEEDFFRKALAKTGLAASDVVYLDDMAEYVAVGKSLGLRAFHYTFNDAELKAFLAENGLEIPAQESRAGHLGC
jgi:HAD superfamily hydrolase (TIGR01509 family)